MATHSSFLTWRIPRTEEPGELQSIGPQRSDTSKVHYMHHDFSCLRMKLFFNVNNFIVIIRQMTVFHITIALMLGITMLPSLIMLLDLFKTCYLLNLEYLGMLNEIKNYKTFQIVLLLKQNT